MSEFRHMTTSFFFQPDSSNICKTHFGSIERKVKLFSVIQIKPQWMHFYDYIYMSQPPTADYIYSQIFYMHHHLYTY